MPRVVLDTNVMLSALFFQQGRLSWLRLEWQGQRIVPLVSRTTTQELIRVLAYPKFKLSVAERSALLADYLPFCEVVTIPDPPPEVVECRDEYDLPFLWLALTGNADYLVTGDSDLLALAACRRNPHAGAVDS